MMIIHCLRNIGQLTMESPFSLPDLSEMSHDVCEILLW